MQMCSKIITKLAFYWVCYNFWSLSLKIVNEINAVRMWLIHWSTLVEIQRIPHNDENLTIDALEGIDKYDANRR